MALEVCMQKGGFIVEKIRNWYFDFVWAGKDSARAIPRQSWVEYSNQFSRDYDHIKRASRRGRGQRGNQLPFRLGAPGNGKYF